MPFLKLQLRYSNKAITLIQHAVISTYHSYARFLEALETNLQKKETTTKYIDTQIHTIEKDICSVSPFYKTGSHNIISNHNV